MLEQIPQVERQLVAQAVDSVRVDGGLQGPEFARTIDAVTATLTTEALRSMNAAVDLEGERPPDVARRFLQENGLLD